MKLRDLVRLAVVATPFLVVAPPLMAQTASYTYDSLGRLASATNPSGTVLYSYDNAGNRTSVTVEQLSCSPISAHQTLHTNHNYTISCTDNYGTSPTVTSLNNPSGYTVSYTGTLITVNGFGSGTETFSFTATDSLGAVSTAQVSITSP